MEARSDSRIIRRYSVQEYLDFDEANPGCYEFLKGIITGKEGAWPNMEALRKNIVAAWNQSEHAAYQMWSYGPPWVKSWAGPNTIQPCILFAPGKASLDDSEPEAIAGICLAEPSEDFADLLNAPNREFKNHPIKSLTVVRTHLA